MPDSLPYIQILGRATVRVRGEVVDRLPTRRLEALLAYLTLHPGWQSRERIAEALWPEQPEGKATASLRNALSVLRRILNPIGIEGDAALESTRIQARLAQGRCACDVWEFQQAVDRRDFASAVAFYSGELLPDVHDDWIEPFRSSLQDAFHRALAAETDRLMQCGESSRALELAERWRESDPWEGEAVRVRLIAMARTGRRKAALAELDRMQAEKDSLLVIDADLLRQEILDALEASEPAPNVSHPSPPRSSPAARRLPTYLSRFFGREEELGQVQQWMRSPSRLLSIVGTGGVGKTRLAVEASRRGPVQDLDVAFVPLAGSDTEAGFWAALMDVLELRVVESESIESTLIAFLGRQPKPIVLVLDNLEQLIEPAIKVLMTLMGAGEHVKFLVTSRELLGIEGEQLLVLSPFETSEPEASAPGLAVQMFVDRARNSRADFSLTSRNSQELTGLCRELEGLPLAIEIAAGWSAALTVGEIRDRVRDRRIVARKRGHDARHQSLEACIDWSFSLLGPDTREFVCMLSLFRGGWTLEACEAVTQVPDAAELLARLVDRSLVQLNDTDVGLRFSMLESVRTFSRSRLSDSSAREAGARMADFFKEMGYTHGNPCAGEQERINHRKLDRESENVEAIVTLCEEGIVDVDAAMGVAGRMQLHWTYRGQASFGLAVVERLLRVPSDKPPGTGTFLGLQTLAVLLQDMGQYKRAEEAVERMLALADRQNDEEALFRALTQLGNLQNRQGRFAESLGNHRMALRVALDAGIPRMEAVAQCNLAESLCGLGRLDEATEHYARSAELDRQNGNIAGEATLCLGFLQILQGEVSAGLGNFHRYLSNALGLGFDRGIWRAVYYAALAAANLGDVELGLRLRDAAGAMFATEEYVFDATESNWIRLVDEAFSGTDSGRPVVPIERSEAIELALRFLQARAS